MRIQNLLLLVAHRSHHPHRDGVLLRLSNPRVCEERSTLSEVVLRILRATWLRTGLLDRSESSLGESRPASLQTARRSGGVIR